MGKKKGKKALKEKIPPTPPEWTVNRSISARNLSTEDLAAVIFGCTHYTIKECLSRMLFGLPAAHFPYVRKVYPGMALFLFNYSDRKMHGVFEAASTGQLNINTLAWTGDDSEKSPFPAQVRIQIRTRYQPLVEDQYKPILADNYFQEKHFWNELDPSQTKKMLNLFMAQGVMKISSLPCWTDKRSNASGESTSSCHVGNSSAGAEIACPTWPTAELVSPWTAPSWGKGPEEPVIKSEQQSFCSDASVLKQQITSVMLERESSSMVDFSNIEPPPEPEDATEMYEEQTISDWEKSSLIEEINEELESEDGGEIASFMTAEDLVDGSVLESDGLLDQSSDFHNIVAKLIQVIEELKASGWERDQRISSLEQDLMVSRAEIQHLKDQHGRMESCTLAQVEQAEENVSLSNSQCSNHQESLLLVGGFDGSSWLAAIDSYLPSQDLMEPLCSMTFKRTSASSLNFNGEIYILGGTNGTSWYDTVESYNLACEKWTNWPSLNKKKGNLAGVSINGKIFVVGGGNRAECFSEVELLDPNIGSWIPVRSMLHKRFAPAAAGINGILYVTGGYDGNQYLKSTEIFDPRECSWRRLQSMSTRRGCHSVVVLHEQLYAIGGYDGCQMVQSVEVLEPRTGSWRIVEPMAESRGYAGAVAVGGKIYVIGGVTNNEADEVLSTVECYEDQRWVVTDLKAVGKRCHFSAVAL
ncbi:Kelch repeat type 1 [Dillenia turbinata]|uniref:Kelch repeat type 1 n=1 Tax=Dillenia turbinata TaxID=194707 RepID=A0AAN8V8H6_9MAGN